MLSARESLRAPSRTTLETRRVGCFNHRMPDQQMKNAYDRVEKHIEDRYGIPVMISDVISPNTGDFNGVEIKLDYDQELDSAFFVLVHLFGHTVQWNISAEYRRLGYNVEPGRSEEELRLIYDYEKDASRISLSLMHECGITDLDQWLSDWWAADWRYLQHFYRTSERLNFRSLITPGAELLTPLPIPPFRPHKWVSRWAF